MPIYSTIRMTIPLEKQREVSRILTSIAEQTRLEPGCLFCRVYRDLHEEEFLMFEEAWDNDEDMDRHLRSHLYRKLLLVLDMASEKPDIDFRTVLHTGGIEVIEKARL